MSRTEVARETITFEVDDLHLTAERWHPATQRHGTVVLLHGVGQTRHSWSRTSKRLAARGWECLALDARGHGDSSWDSCGNYSTDAVVGDLAHVVATLDTPPVLVGASWGGVTALLFEAERAQASRLVLVDVTPRLEQQGSERIIGFMTSNVDGFATLDDAAEAIRRYNPRRRSINLDGLKKNLRLGEDDKWHWHWDPRVLVSPGDERHTAVVAATRSAARKVRVPTMVVRGLTSDVLTPEGAADLLGLIPHASLVEVNAGHMVAGDDNDVFASHLLTFLA